MRHCCNNDRSLQLWCVISAVLLLLLLSGERGGTSRAWCVVRNGSFRSLYRPSLAFPTSFRSRSSQPRRAAGAQTMIGSTPRATTRLFKNLLSVQECLELYRNQTTGIANEERNVVRFVDGSWYHKGSRNGRVDFDNGPRIPGSVYFDLDDISCSPALFPEANPRHLSHMQPPRHLMAAYMDACGIRATDHVVVYGASPDCAFLPRVWFTFRHVLGHERTSLMQGSLEDWMAIGGPVDTATLQTATLWARELDLTRTPSYPITSPSLTTMVRVIDADTMKAHVMAKQQQANMGNLSSSLVIVDTRGSSFKYGHMPGAVHVPYSSLYGGGSDQPPIRMLTSLDRVQALLDEAGIVRPSIQHDADGLSPTQPAPPAQRVVITCGSGVSVCSLVLALEECGHLHDGASSVAVDVYDGSWEEWDRLDNVPKSVSVPL
jgi:thiosulfate/3-mercaptopyruvate sulfurtransferase